MKKKRVIDEACQPLTDPAHPPYKRFHSLHFHKDLFTEQEITQTMNDLENDVKVNILKHPHTPSGIYPHLTSKNFYHIKVDDRQECVVPYLKKRYTIVAHSTEHGPIEHLLENTKPRYYSNKLPPRITLYSNRQHTASPSAPLNDSLSNSIKPTAPQLAKEKSKNFSLKCCIL